MKITAEISVYPLDASFGTHVLTFIHILRDSDSISCRTNSMSTQVSGEYSAVMKAVERAYEEVFGTLDSVAAALTIKILNRELDLTWLPI